MGERALSFAKRHSTKISLSIALISTVIFGYIMGIDLMHQVYEFRREFTILNEASKPRPLPKEYKKIILPPTIKGWQELVNYEVLLNGRRVDEIGILPYNGNLIINLDLQDLRPLEVINITVISIIKVTIALPLIFTRGVMISEDSSGNLNEIPSYLKVKYCMPFNDWDWREEREWKEIKDFVNRIKNSSTNVFYLILQAINWVKERVRYEETPTILSPIDTLRRGKGDCADMAVLISTLLKMMGVPSYVVLAAYYEPNAQFVSKGEHIEVMESGILMHSFAMAYVPQIGWIPIDLAIRDADSVEDYINKAMILRSDRLLILSIVINEDPNEYLIYSTSEGLRVHIRITLRKINDPKWNIIVLSLIFLLSELLSMIAISLMKGFRRTFA